MRVRKIMMYDPPEGWKYGFPKPYLPFEGESLTETLIRDGYPLHLLDGNHMHCRFYETEIMERY